MAAHENRLLASLPPSDLAALAAHLHIVSLDAGAALQYQDQPLQHVYFPHDGLVSLLAMTPDGETMEVTSIGRSGAVYPVWDADKCMLTAVAQVGMRLSRISTPHLRLAQQKSKALNRAFGACREGLLLQFRQSLVCAGLHTADQRLPRWLLETADRLESEVMPTTQDQVAQRLGVRRTTVTLLAGKLQNARAIAWGRARVEILDRARLETMACRCYGSLRESSARGS